MQKNDKETNGFSNSSASPNNRAQIKQQIGGNYNIQGILSPKQVAVTAISDTVFANLESLNELQVLDKSKAQLNRREININKNGQDMENQEEFQKNVDKS